MDPVGVRLLRLRRAALRHDAREHKEARPVRVGDFVEWGGTIWEVLACPDRFKNCQHLRELRLGGREVDTRTQLQLREDLMGDGVRVLKTVRPPKRSEGHGSKPCPSLKRGDPCECD